jgi:Zn-dependent protease
MWVSLAGPASNLLMALIASIPFQLGLVSIFGSLTSNGQILPSLDKLLFEFISINLLLFLFNLIPVAPLDGEKILYFLLPAPGQRFMDNIRPYGPLILLALVFSGWLLPFNILWTILSPPLNALMGVLVG